MPAFPPTGDLVGTPSLAIPGRSEYRVPYRMSGAVRRAIERFAPNIVHVSSPDPLGRAAVAFARQRGLPAVASLHPRFETYPRFYGFAFLEQVIYALAAPPHTRLTSLTP